MIASRRHTPVVLALLLAGCGPGADAQLAEFAPPNPEAIERAEVERVIRVLASDEMRGRRAFTEDAMRAAEFLAAEFEAAGLEPMPGATGFLQGFEVRSLTTTSVEMTVGGATVAAERVAARLGSESIAWTGTDAEVVVVGPGDGLQQVVIGAVQGSGHRILLVNEAHADDFQRFSRFMRGANRVVGGDGPSVVMALVNASDADDVAVTASARVTADALANVAGMIPGRRADEFVLFSAHYDHLGIRPAVEGDSIANGANDDASGTAAVVALADYLAGRGTPERSILFAAFTAEEGGGYGSRYYSTQLDPDQIVAMFNIEMIGKPAVSGPNSAWITGFDRSSFGPLLQQAVEGTAYEFYADPYPDQNLFYRSDNATLARLGVPAHSISTTPIDVDPDYHQVSDEVETLDLDHMTHTIRAIAMGAETMISGEATPTRVDPATVNE